MTAGSATQKAMIGEDARVECWEAVVAAVVVREGGMVISAVEWRDRKRWMQLPQRRRQDIG